VAISKHISNLTTLPGIALGKCLMFMTLRMSAPIVADTIVIGI
jgi:hypothetical protein